MKFPPQYIKTDRITTLLAELEALKMAFSLLAIPEKTRAYLRKSSLLKSSLYSARIEGNKLRLEDFSQRSRSSSRQKIEVTNIALALEYMAKTPQVSLTIDFLKQLHTLVLGGLSSSAGSLRSEESAIFNQAGIAVYLTPAPQKIFALLEELIMYTNSSIDPCAVRAAVVHIWFEKIHPYVDGNGRVGRLVSQFILKIQGYDLGGLVPLEEYIDEHRQEYYNALTPDTSDVTPFVEFFLEALVFQGKKTLIQTQEPVPEYRAELLPRRAEIFDVIRDHKMVSFDALARRFRAVSPSTLHYDCQQLIKKGYIKKLGTTRGVVYVPVDR